MGTFFLILFVIIGALADSSLAATLIGFALDGFPIYGPYVAKGLMAKGGDLTGFEVAGADGRFVAATAKIDGNTVVVTSDAVMEPRFVRYGWANSPQCNLFSGEGLPASPFTSAE